MNELLYRPGLEGIIAGETAVSTIEGGLRYRGYPVEALADHTTFDEVAYLMLHGDLPRRAELAAFQERLFAAMALPSAIIEILRRLPPDANMMDVMRTGASLLSSWDPDSENMSRDANLRKAERLTAQLPLIMAAQHRLRNGVDPVVPRKGLSFSAQVLWLLTAQEPSVIHTKAMDVSLIMYAEHEFNASTFAARVVCSTLADLHSAIVAAIGALKGPLHGGANERVMEVLQEVGHP
ncbi:MAG TPA: citrate/2-methylcitrate synthase, partial [Pirellulaceae bacterium]